MSYEIQNKVALVTGANRGIGKAILESFLNHGAAKVYAAVRRLDSAAPLVEQFGDKVVPILIDVSDPATIRAAAQTADDVEVVVNNAGVLKTAGPLDPAVHEALDFEMKVNVHGLLAMAQAFAPVLKSNGGGALVQLNSVASLKCFSDIATYSASKAASYSITQALRDVLGRNGTVVLSVHPGPIATEMASDAGFGDAAELPSVVGDGIVTALRVGDFHLFPDSVAKQFGEAYESFATNVVEADGSEE
tara:strand:+ start:2005 stop:2748 length:744 start_codon:yes stop_codon:yes gene_type:complete